MSLRCLMPMLPTGSTGICLNDGDAMSEYYIAFDYDGQPYIVHGLFNRKGWQKKNHKYYQKIIDGLKTRYFYSKEEWDAYNKSLKSKLHETWDGGVSAEEAKKKRLLATQAHRDAGMHKKVRDERLKENGAKIDENGNVTNNFVSGLKTIISPITDAVGLTDQKKKVSELFDSIDKYDTAKQRAADADAVAKQAEEKAKQAYEKSIKGRADRLIKKFSNTSLSDIFDSNKRKEKEKDAEKEKKKSSEYFSRDDLDKLYKEGNRKFKNLISKLDKLDIEYKPLEKLKDNRDEETIINSLGGGDMTDGSCSSLAFAFIGNKAGYNVLDFRSGESRKFFMDAKNIMKIATLDGVISQKIENKGHSSPFDDAKQLLGVVEEGKDYYFAAGQHAAIVRKVDGQYQYLELQSHTSNGWKTLDDRVISSRFLCSHYNPEQTRLIGVTTTILIDANSLAQSQEFISMLGYINTDPEKQRKGAGGGVR